MPVVLRTLCGCSPFIACGLISSFTNWRIGTVVAVTLSAVLVLTAARQGRGIGAAVIETSAVVFCAVALVLAFVTPQAAIRDFIGALSTGWLALTAWCSVVLGRPFTKVAERRLVDASVWEQPPFHRTHLVVTSMWAAGFTATAVVLGVVEYAAPHSGVIEILVQVAGNFVPAVLAYRYLAGRRDGVTVMR
jgi:hypothetical protein